jgi:hypothetical protein
MNNLPWTQYTHDGKLNIADSRGMNIASVIMRDDAKLIVEAVNSYEANQKTVEQLQAGFSPQLEEALKDKRYYRDMAQQLQAQVEKCKSEMAKIPYRCGWYDGVGLECTNKDPHKVNYCPCAICPRHKAPEATEKNSAI